jgi:hypothetical protein
MSDEDPGELKFHYSREKRLEHAPENVRKAYEEGYTPNKGFIRGLVGNPGSRSMFISIIILCLMISALTVFGPKDDSATISGVTFKIKAFLYGENVYVTLSCTPGKDAVSGPLTVLATISGIDATGAAVTQTAVSDGFSNSELMIRTTLSDFDIRKVKAGINFNKTDVIVSATVDRK